MAFDAGDRLQERKGFVAEERQVPDELTYESVKGMANNYHVDQHGQEYLPYPVYHPDIADAIEMQNRSKWQCI